MRSEDIQQDGAGAPGHAGVGSTRARYTRRQMLGRVSTGAAVGAAAWVVPEILTAKPASGATLSVNPPNTGGGGTGVSTSPTSTGSTGTPTPATDASTSDGGKTPATSGSLAFTGLDIKRDAEIGAAMIAGGWAMHKWASRVPKAARAGATTDEAGSPSDTA